MTAHYPETLRRLCGCLAIILGSALLHSLHAQPKVDSPLPTGVRLQRDIAYVDNGHARQKLDLYLPSEPTSGGPRPLIIWVHGGGWKMGDKYPCLAARLVLDGYAVASVNYRLSQDAPFPAQI